MKLSDVKTFRDLCASFFILSFEPEDKPNKRARKKDGRYQADDPKTLNINEAYKQKSK
jgi:hypothetical protein|tara:strand:+ start:1027 stop:1200 length:174 start_codon:yes stop_codon:yes gene_type:complete